MYGLLYTFFAAINFAVLDDWFSFNIAFNKLKIAQIV